MLVIGGILGFSGPFGTFEYLPTVPRLAYWLAMAFATYGTGYIVGTAAGRMPRRQLGGARSRRVPVHRLADAPR